MLYSTHAPVSVSIVIAILALAVVSGVAAVRWPRVLLLSLPVLYWWTRWESDLAGYASDDHVWPFRAAMIAPLLGLFAGWWVRRRRASA